MVWHGPQLLIQVESDFGSFLVHTSIHAERVSFIFIVRLYEHISTSSNIYALK